ncbi:MAG TPA: sporulation initiation factor Spo0A C-terminal domain-containing protein [Candidatus Blautia avistercoris]|uniref:sporulation initiation factor Spo0A C-terminal domain-containing protein n=1 Tax=Blautia sp. An249 TaxID=1965603 RepID=UPI000B377D18|nr:sporulation initiation factor Spo0A C-terminal domain-containing protein [Blautia sp. An249]OUO77732.1 hypothetical protein B5F53_12890 [Blautia sp. An249]HIY17879.1 sporulation initiation factor Spo0A C-terminal domain-containing protein [Candidatus Blautia avistercoris]
MERIKEVLKQEGISQSYRGYWYIVSSVKLVMEDEQRLLHVRKEIYQKVAEEYQIDVRSVERDIRTVRDVFCRKNPTKEFLFLKNDRHLYPREFIELLAEYVRQRN